MTKTPVIDKKTKPFTYSKFKRLKILYASPLEQLLMVELHGMFGAMEWLTQSEPIWDREDMRQWVRDIAPKIDALYPKPPRRLSGKKKNPKKN